MKKTKLFFFWIALFSLFCYSCMDDRLDPVPGEKRQTILFSVNDAREFFENNATDLSPLSFTGTSVARSAGRANVELNPEWNNAMISGHKGVTLIEIPLYSTSTVLVREGIFKNKRLVGTRTTISERRLIIAKRANGEVDMFVATIVPEARSIEDDLSEMLKDFRYLGGGSFSGKVFCSTLEGKFVKAFGYTDGKLNGTLNTRIRQASGERHTGDEAYSRLIFSETSSTRASMFSGNESGGGGGINYDKCQHGYTKGFCPHGCRAEVEEVEIITCRYCGTQNGCVCSRCFYCGNREPECSCTRCTRCHEKMQNCRCYEYPDPDKPVNPPGGGGGGINPGNPTLSQPDVLNEYIGEDNYYLKRVEDFKKRYPNAEEPDYYKNYGDFYLHEFKYKTYNMLSSEGKTWCLKTLELLQRAMSNLLSKDPDLELDHNAFTKAAFATHVNAYCEAGIMWLSVLDKALIFTTVYPSDLFSENGLKQVAEVSAKQIQTYMQNPTFAWEQAQELSRNWEMYQALMLTYLQEKDKSDPRKVSPRGRSGATVDSDNLMRLFFGESVEYFKATFGDQVSFPI